MFMLAPVLALIAAPGARNLAADVSKWEVRPDFVGPGAAADSSVSPLEGGLRFTVTSPRARMKWLRTCQGVSLEMTPWLVLTCRAEGLGSGDGDYLIHVADDSPDGLTAIARADLAPAADVQVLAVDLTDRVRGDTPKFVAVQVISEDGPAHLDVLDLRFAPEAPEGARVVGAGATVPTTPPRTIDLGAPGDWAAQPTWLSSPGTGAVAADGGVLRFSVAETGRGMKWSHTLPEPVDLSQWRYATVEYRASGTGQSDYAACSLGPGADGSSSCTIAPTASLIPDGSLRRMTVPLAPVAARTPRMTGLALQVAALRPNAWMEIHSITLSQKREGVRLGRALPFDLPPAAGLGWRVLDLAGAHVAASADAAPPEALAYLRRAAGVEGWFGQRSASYRNIPLALALEGSAPVIAPGSPGEIEVPVGAAGTELYLLALVGTTGEDQAARGGGRFLRVPDADRFVVELRYAGGRSVECVPRSVPSDDAGPGLWGLTQGLQVLRCPLTPGSVLDSAVLRVQSDQLGVGLAAASLRTGPPILPDLDEMFLVAPPLVLAEPEGEASAERLGVDAIRVTVPGTVGEVRSTPGGDELRLRVLGANGVTAEAAPTEPFRLTIDGKPIAPATVKRDPPEPSDGGWLLRRSCAGLAWSITVRADKSLGTGLQLEVRNTADRSVTLGVTGPEITLALPGEAEPTYCFPRLDAVVAGEDCDLRAEYSGWGIGHQFLAASSSDSKLGFALYTSDTGATPRDYLLRKHGHEVTLGVAYAEIPLAPGQSLGLSPTWLGGFGGDWHTALVRYRSWYRETFPPAAPRQEWFRRVWNFRQRFLYWLDPLWTDTSKPVDLHPAAREAEEQFGGVDYLHIFDWGNAPGVGRVYARTGDTDPGEKWPGGYPAMRDAMDALRREGVPVGLYIEGYLFETKSPLGSRIGEKVAMRGSDGKALFWPQATEVYACPGVREWRDIQAETYGRVAKALNSDGMYIDEFGFAFRSRQCWATDHGHPVPSNCITEEANLTRAVREALDASRPGAVIYTEESPPDVNARLQDGSFTYAMQWAMRNERTVPLNSRRFAIPDFKTIEILVCDQPTGTWASGPLWVFFNGEAIWLEGPAAEWFGEQTRANIRRCHAILKRHQDAFASDNVTPLVPTLAPGIYANRFESANEIVFTLYNARHMTFEGPVLAMPEGGSGRVLDEWNGGRARVSDSPAGRAIETRIAPLSVGCIVVRR